MRKIVGSFVVALIVATSAYAQDQVKQLTLTAAASCPVAGTLVVNVQGQAAIGIQITGTWVGTIQFQQAIDLATPTYTTLAMTPNGGGTAATSTTGNGLWTASLGARSVCINFSAFTSGTATVSVVSTVSRVGLPAGTIGNLSSASIQYGTAPLAFVINGARPGNEQAQLTNDSDDPAAGAEWLISSGIQAAGHKTSAYFGAEGTLSSDPIGVGRAYFLANNGANTSPGLDYFACTGGSCTTPKFRWFTNGSGLTNLRGEIGDTGLILYPPQITAGTDDTTVTVADVTRVRYQATITPAAGGAANCATQAAGFKAAALTADCVIATLPAGVKLVGAYADVTAGFTCSGTCTGTKTFGLGISAGGVEVFASGLDVVAVGRFGLADANMGSQMTRAAQIQSGYLPSWTATTTLTARFTSGTGNWGNAAATFVNAGSVTFTLLTEKVK